MISRHALRALLASVCILGLTAEATAQTATAPAAPPTPPVITFRSISPMSSVDMAAQIDNAMALRAPKIIVNLSPYTTTLPEPVAAWLKRIDETNGEIRTRSIEGNPLVAAALAQFVAKLLPLLFNLAEASVQRWLAGLGEPAKDYNAMIITAQQGPSARCFVRVEFYLRKSAGWAAVASGGQVVAKGDAALTGTPTASTTACPVV